jgi:hypothetical protein
MKKKLLLMGLVLVITIGSQSIGASGRGEDFQHPLEDEGSHGSGITTAVVRQDDGAGAVATDQASTPQTQAVPFATDAADSVLQSSQHIPAIDQVDTMVAQYKSVFKEPNEGVEFTITVRDACEIDELWAPNILNLHFGRDHYYYGGGNGQLRHELAYVLSKFKSMQERNAFLGLCVNTVIFNGGPFYVPRWIGGKIAKKVWGYKPVYGVERDKLHFMYTVTLLSPDRQALAIEQMPNFLQINWFQNYYKLRANFSNSLHEYRFEPSGILLGINALLHLSPGITPTQIATLGRNYQRLIQGRCLDTFEAMEMILRLSVIPEAEQEEFGTLFSVYNAYMLLKPFSDTTIFTQRRESDPYHVTMDPTDYTIHKNLFLLLTSIPASERAELASLASRFLPQTGKIGSLLQKFESPALKAYHHNHKTYPNIKELFVALASLPQQERAPFSRAVESIKGLAGNDFLEGEKFPLWVLKHFLQMNPSLREPLAYATRLYMEQNIRNEDKAPSIFKGGLDLVNGIKKVVLELKGVSLDALKALPGRIGQGPVTFNELQRLVKIDPSQWNSVADMDVRAERSASE